VLPSIRKPKKLTVYGSNEKGYQFLIKGSEDLRLDQRVEELFEVMNKIFFFDPECQSREVSLVTFQILPMTKSLGLIEWVDQS